VAVHRADSGADPALAVEDLGKGRRGDDRAALQLALGQGMLLYEVGEPLHKREFGMLVYRVLGVGDE
jgi:hypothetical protein